MPRTVRNSSSARQRGLPEGGFTALFCGILLIGTFALASAFSPMPPSERWAALTTFAVIALAYTLQGSPGIYDALGRTVRRDTRSLVVLVSLVPTLYLAYSTIVEEFSWIGLVIAVVFAGVPTLALLRSRGVRGPTALDFVAVFYLWASVALRLVPQVTLPQQGGLVSFFALITVPLLLVLLAARGWPGLGYTWFLSGVDFRRVLQAALVILFVLAPLATALGLVQAVPRIPSVPALLSQAVLGYFFVALPAEIMFRGVIQNGVARLLGARSPTGTSTATPLEPRWWREPQNIALVVAALVSGLAAVVAQSDWRHGVIALVAAVSYGWVYKQTGKVTASAFVHLLVVWLFAIFGS